MSLSKLIEAVEISNEAAAKLEARKAYPDHAPDMGRAFHGSLDAAKRLHNALLPGWWWSIGTCKVSDDARVSPDDDRRAPDGGEWADYTDIDQRPPGNPARAWLLSILRALEGKEGR